MDVPSPVLHLVQEECKCGAFIKKTNTNSKISIRFLLMFHVPVLCMWPPLTVSELERVNIVVGCLGILSRMAHQ